MVAAGKGGGDEDGGCAMGNNNDRTGNAANVAADADNVARDVAAVAVMRDLTGSVVPMGGDASSPTSMGIDRELRDASKGGGGMTDGKPGKKIKAFVPSCSRPRRAQRRWRCYAQGRRKSRALMRSGLGLRRTRESWPQ